MQKSMNTSYLDWSRTRKPTILSRGIASIIVPQLRGQGAGVKVKTSCIWPSGIENADSRYLTRRVWSR